MGDNEQNEAFIVQGEMVNALLHHLDVHKSMEPHKGTDGDCGRACHATFHHSPEVLANRWGPSWEEVNMMPIYKKGWRKGLGNYKPVDLTLVLGKTMEEIFLNATMQHWQDNQGIRTS